MCRKSLSAPKVLLLAAISLAGGLTASAQNYQFTFDSANSKVDWKIKSQAEVGADSVNVFKPGYDAAKWVKAKVPGTVFADYVNAGLEKDPNWGDNIYKVDKAKYDRNFWYRTEFAIPADFTRERVFLNFKGINRKADIYVNGKKVGSLDGFMQPGHFDITGIVTKTGKNVLAVLTYCPKAPLVNYASPTYISAGSWDWMPYVPGLNSGITDKVWLSNNGSLTIKDPWIRTDLPTNGRADLTVAVDVENSAPAFVQGELKGVIQPGNVEFTQKVFIGANSKGTVKFDTRKFAQLAINNPKLWWPNGYGDPNLYTCTITLSLNGQVSDTKEVKFGIKKYTYDTDGGVLHIWINGTRVFLKGGNWGMSEYMLRCRGDEYFTKVKLHKEMNFNMIRNWIGSTTDDEFYEACDQYGIMIWDDFWLNSIANLPNDIYNFNMNAVEKIKRFRNHPAIAIWCGDNEGFPEPPLSGWLQENIKTFDGNDRYFQPNSKMPNLTGSGPWTNTDITWYFAKSPNGFGGNPGWGLRSEIGTAVFTNFESFKKFMPKEDWWPRNEMWNKHFFGESAGNASPDRYDDAINKRYGAPAGIEDYCRKAQLLNIETNKAMYEGWLDNMWEDASGILTWMSQSAYPSFVWQTYDYYYDLNGAYWGAKKACEPLHIQWNPVNNSIKVINTTRNIYEGLIAELEIYNKDGKRADEYSKTATIGAAPSSATKVFDIPFAQNSVNIALGKPAYASTVGHGEASLATDGRVDTRWASLQNDREWIYVDLGKEETVTGVGISWEEAYGRGFRIEVSNDAKNWDEVYSTSEGNGGVQKIAFDEVKARYVRMAGILRASGWGYSIWEFEVYGTAGKATNLSDVHFIKLKLKDKAGKLVSDNFYWRGNKRSNYTGLGSLPQVNLKVSSKTTKVNGKYLVKATITNPASSAGVAVAVRVQAVKASNGEQILPVFTNDNYFSLVKGESKDVWIEFDEKYLGANDSVKLLVEPYNKPTAK